MTEPPSIELPITTAEEFHVALCQLIVSGVRRNVSVEGGWTARHDDETLPDFDVEITVVTKPVDD